MLVFWYTVASQTNGSQSFSDWGVCQSNVWRAWPVVFLITPNVTILRLDCSLLRYLVNVRKTIEERLPNPHKQEVVSSGKMKVTQLPIQLIPPLGLPPGFDQRNELVLSMCRPKY